MHAAAPALRAAAAPAQRPQARPRARLAIRAGLLDMLPKLQSLSTVGGGTRRAGRAAELTARVDRLLQLADGTDAGVSASPAARAELADLVDELEGQGPAAPLRSPLLFGTWEVLYASKPTTAGGPLRSPLGRALLKGQRATQVITAPNLCVNEVAFKALGALPGAARQEGTIDEIDARTFQLTFPTLDGKRAGGPPKRVISIAYLDERVRLARALPQEAGGEGSFYVFRRVEAAGGAASEEEEAPAPRAAFPRFELPELPSFKKEGAATMAERSYARGAAGSRAAPTPRGGGAAAARAQAAAAATRERLLERERAAEAKASAEAERRRAAAAVEAERAAAAEGKQAARAQLQALTAEAAEAAAEAREAAAEFKAAEREASALLRQAAAARSTIECAAAAAEAALACFGAAEADVGAAEAEAAEAKRATSSLAARVAQLGRDLAPSLPKPAKM
jgi:hypothetical protein